MSEGRSPEFSPVGDGAIRVAFGIEISPRIQTRIRRFCWALASSPLPGLLEWVPGYAVVTVYYQPWIISYEALCNELDRCLRRRLDVPLPEARLVEIPVCYGSHFGPDLEEVAAAKGLTPRQVIRRHLAPLYRVYFLGFLPGFAYLGGLPASLAAPRRATPRLHVPAGAVGLAETQTGVYPSETPGGWQIIGRTPLHLYDANRQPPALLATGERVKFIAISVAQFEEMSKLEEE